VYHSFITKESLNCHDPKSKAGRGAIESSSLINLSSPSQGRDNLPASAKCLAAGLPVWPARFGHGKCLFNYYNSRMLEYRSWLALPKNCPRKGHAKAKPQILF